jgi:hypothetical protein
VLLDDTGKTRTDHMAVARPAARPAAEETSEREYQATLNRAVEDTENEIFAEALGEDELDNDGDTTLEDMGEGLEGEVEETEPEGEDGAEESDGTEDEDGDGEPEAAEGDDAETETDADEQRDERGRFRGQQDDRRIPPGRLREEANSRRAAEERASTLERQLAELNGRFSELSARVNAPGPKQAMQEPKPKPDMFADPEKYEQWVLEQAEHRAETKLEQRFQSFEQRQQAASAQRVDNALADAARGSRSFEFGAAYNALTSLDPRDPQARNVVGRIYNAADPEKALWDWWEQNGGPEYRERILEQLTPREQREAQRQGTRPQGQPRHVIRPGRSLPSLNAATGSNRQQIADPEMYDGSEESVFRYGSRRG